MSASPQPALPSFTWYDTKEFARLYGRHERTVRRWCVDGTATDFGFAISYAPNPGGRSYSSWGWRIGIPGEIAS